MVFKVKKDFEKFDAAGVEPGHANSDTQSNSSATKELNSALDNNDNSCSKTFEAKRTGQGDALQGQAVAICGSQPRANNRPKPTLKRYSILLMFSFAQAIKSFQWLCLASITNLVASFYNVNNIAINWTTILFMVTFILLALPTCFLMKLIGLRGSALISSIGITTGLAIKCFSCDSDKFLYLMLGHLVIGIAEPFSYSSYSQLVSVWFPDDQVASATSTIVVFEDFGLALGFLVPPLLVGNNPEDLDAIGRGLSLMFVACCLISIVNTIAIILFFEEQPKEAPGLARLAQIAANNKTDHLRRAVVGNGNESTASSVADRQQSGAGERSNSPNLFQLIGLELKQYKEFMFNKSFINFLICYGIIVGISYSAHTLLNQMIINKPQLSAGDRLAAGLLPVDGNSSLASGRENQIVSSRETIVLEQDPVSVVGGAGFTLIISGIIGAAFTGYILDKFHRYKLTLATMYVVTFASIAALSLVLDRLKQNQLAIYLIMIPLGFAFESYRGGGFDFGVELMYPHDELTSSTLLNISSQVFGIPISLLGSYLVDKYGNEALGAFLCLLLLGGFLLNCLQGAHLKRQAAVQVGRQQEASLA